MTSSYFTTVTFRFLRELSAHNKRDWFTTNKQRYEEVLRQPYLRLITDLQTPLTNISAHYCIDPRSQSGSLFRQYRDTRFSSEKQPYKTWAGVRFFHKCSRETEAPSLYPHIAPQGCFVGGGLWRPSPDTIKKIRIFLTDNPTAWIKATRGKTFATRFALGGEMLKRLPHGFNPSHALIDDIKRKDFVATQEFDERLAASAELKPLVTDAFKAISPMIDYLCAVVDLDF